MNTSSATKIHLTSDAHEPTERTPRRIQQRRAVCRQVAPNHVLTSDSYVTVNLIMSFYVFIDNKIGLSAYYATFVIDGHEIVSYSVATHLTWTCPEARPHRVQYVDCDWTRLCVTNL